VGSKNSDGRKTMEKEQGTPTTGMKKQTAPSPSKDNVLVALVKTLLNWNYLKSGIKKDF
jgi:hypothetical protein